MKKIIIILMLIAMPAMAAKKLDGYAFRCYADISDSTVMKCEEFAVMGTTDDSTLQRTIQRDMTLTAGQTTTINAFLVNRIAAVKTVLSIP